MPTRHRAAPGMALLWSLSLVAVDARAQTVWNVAPPDIQSVIQQANPGDVLVLTAPSPTTAYHPFTLDKGLTIRGTGNRIGWYPGSPQPPGVYVSVPAGQIAHLVGLDFSDSYHPQGDAGTTLFIQSGSTRIENCTMSAAPAMIVGNANLVVTASTITGLRAPCGTCALGPGIHATNSTIVLRDCEVTGGEQSCSYVLGCASWSAPPQPAARIVGTSLHAERTTFRGGFNPTMYPGDGATAIEANNSAVRLADCHVIGGNATFFAGGAPLVNVGNVPVELRNTTLVSGTPGGALSSGLVIPNATLVRAVLAPFWTRGVTSTITLAGEPNALFGVLLTPADTPITIPEVIEPLWAGGAMFVHGGLLDAAGSHAMPVAVPNVASLRDAAVWCQALSGVGLPLRASTLFGGLVH